MLHSETVSKRKKERKEVCVVCGGIWLAQNTEVKGLEAGGSWDICGAGNGQLTEGGGCEGGWDRDLWPSQRWLLIQEDRGHWRALHRVSHRHTFWLSVENAVGGS